MPPYKQTEKQFWLGEKYVKSTFIYKAPADQGAVQIDTG